MGVAGGRTSSAFGGGALGAVGEGGGGASGGAGGEGGGEQNASWPAGPIGWRGANDPITRRAHDSARLIAQGDRVVCRGWSEPAAENCDGRPRPALLRTDDVDDRCPRCGVLYNAAAGDSTSGALTPRLAASAPRPPPPLHVYKEDPVLPLPALVLLLRRVKRRRAAHDGAIGCRPPTWWPPLNGLCATKRGASAGQVESARAGRVRPAVPRRPEWAIQVGERLSAQQISQPVVWKDPSDRHSAIPSDATTPTGPVVPQYFCPLMVR